VHKSGADARDLGVDGDQIGQELLGAERAQGVSTLKLSQMQGHEAACLCEGWSKASRPEDKHQGRDAELRELRFYRVEYPIYGKQYEQGE